VKKKKYWQNKVAKEKAESVLSVQYKRATVPLHVPKYNFFCY